MEGTKPRTASSLGMFDLLKGVGMLLIVFAHTSELYPVGDISTITPVTFFLFAYRLFRFLRIGCFVFRQWTKQKRPTICG